MIFFRKIYIKLEQKYILKVIKIPKILVKYLKFCKSLFFDFFELYNSKYKTKIQSIKIYS